MDKRGISPIVATIILIAMTVVAGGVIGIFVSGMYTPSTTVTAGEISGTIYDNDNTAEAATYGNGRVVISFTLTSGAFYSTNDPTTGLKVQLQATTPGTATQAPPASSNWGPYFIGPTAVTQSGGFVTYTDTTTNSKIKFTIRVPVDAAYTMTRGPTGTITLENLAKTLDNICWNDNTEFFVKVVVGTRSVEPGFNPMSPMLSSIP